MRWKQPISTDVIPEEVEVGVGVLVVVVMAWNEAVVVAGEIVVWGLYETGKEVMTEIVVWDRTGESVRLAFCPGNVRTGSWMPNVAQSS